MNNGVHFIRTTATRPTVLAAAVRLLPRNSIILDVVRSPFCTNVELPPAKEPRNRSKKFGDVQDGPPTRPDFTRLKEAAVGFEADFTHDLLYAHGVGHFQVNERNVREEPEEDPGVGRSVTSPRFLILPKMTATKQRSIFPNREWKGPNQKLNKLGIKSPNQIVFEEWRPSLTGDCISGPDYIYDADHKLQTVDPYYACFGSRVSKRTFPGADMPLIDFLTKRFGRIPSAYHNLCLKLGLIAVNLEKVFDPMLQIRAGDVITRVTHVHESPVFAKEVKIIYEDNNLLVVEKPASWPVHPCGFFRFNTLLYYLAKKHGYMNLRPVHRLDKATSGLIIFAKTAGISSTLQAQFKSDNTVKEYLALVHGNFMPGSQTISTPIDHHKVTEIVTKKGKEKHAKTTFTRIAYYSEADASLVNCRLHTGRTHQIRLHLQQLGFNIVNDSLYGNSDSTQMAEELRYEKMDEIVETMEQNLGLDNKYDIDTSSTILKDTNVKEWQKQMEKFKTCPHCLVCQGDESEIFRRPTIICLHSFRYKIGEFEFTSQLPDWAENPQSFLEQFKTN